MNKLYIITGPSGVGKSTISKIISKKLEKSALIEGDDVYHLVSGGYVSPWETGNHLDIFWKNSISLIKNFLEDGYDVVYNYIIEKNDLELLKKEFSNYEIKFVVLLVSEEEIVRRDKLRDIYCQMGERSLILLNDFKNQNYDSRYILDTTNMTIDETINMIEKSDDFNI